MANVKKDFDIAVLEVDYRLGALSLRALSARHKISKTRISQLAEEHGWERDLHTKIAAKTQAKLQTQLQTKIAKADSTIKKNETAAEKYRQATEAVRVDVVSSLQADLLAGHQSDIEKYQTMCNGFLTELHLQGLCDADLAKIGELIAMVETQDGEQPDMADINKRLNAFYRLLNLGGRAETFKKLVESKAKLVMLERLSHGIQDSYAPPPPASSVGSTAELNALNSLLGNLRKP